MIQNEEPHNPSATSNCPHSTEESKTKKNPPPPQLPPLPRHTQLKTSASLSLSSPSFPASSSSPSPFPSPSRQATTEKKSKRNQNPTQEESNAAEHLSPSYNHNNHPVLSSSYSSASSSSSTSSSSSSSFSSSSSSSSHRETSSLSSGLQQQQASSSPVKRRKRHIKTSLKDLHEKRQKLDATSINEHHPNYNAQSEPQLVHRTVKEMDKDEKNKGIKPTDTSSEPHEQQQQLQVAKRPRNVDANTNANAGPTYRSKPESPDLEKYREKERSQRLSRYHYPTSQTEQKSSSPKQTRSRTDGNCQHQSPANIGVHNEDLINNNDFPHKSHLSQNSSNDSITTTHHDDNHESKSTISNHSNQNQHQLQQPSICSIQQQQQQQVDDQLASKNSLLDPGLKLSLNYDALVVDSSKTQVESPKNLNTHTDASTHKTTNDLIEPPHNHNRHLTKTTDSPSTPTSVKKAKPDESNRDSSDSPANVNVSQENATTVAHDTATINSPTPDATDAVHVHEYSDVPTSHGDTPSTKTTYVVASNPNTAAGETVTAASDSTTAGNTTTLAQDHAASTSYRDHRVKLYTLNPDGHWGDRGTGYVGCTETPDGTYLRAISEIDGLVLLMSKIRRMQESFYQLQGDTIISWTEEETSTSITDPGIYNAQIEMALSFAETSGCKQIWDHICKVQNRYHNDHGVLNSGLMAGCDEDLGSPSTVWESTQIPPDALHEYRDVSDAVDSALRRANDANSSAIHDVSEFSNKPLPQPETSNLDSLARALNDIVNSGIGRENAIRELLSGNYITKLLDLFTQFEDLEDTESLHSLYNIFRSLFLLGSSNILELMVSEENIFRVIGALEYDAEYYPENRQNKIINVHRKFLEEKVAFKQIVKVHDANIEAKIHTNYRLSYIKDVILPRVLDDYGFSSLTSLVHYNNNEILIYFLNERKSLESVFSQLCKKSSTNSDNSDNTIDNNKANAEDTDHKFSALEYIRFINELSNLSRTSQPQVKVSLFDLFRELKIFDICTNALESEEEMQQIIAVELLMTCLMHDQSVFRRFLCEQTPNHELFRCLMETLFSGKYSGVILQVSELLRNLLDPETISPVSDKDTFLTLFYEKVLPWTLEPLRTWTQGKLELSHGADSALDTAQNQTIDLLGFCVSVHGFRSKYFVLRNDLGGKVVKFLHHPATYIRLSALRFVRAILGTKDEFYLRYVTKSKLFAAIIDLLLLQRSKDNLVQSAILELFEFMKKEKLLIPLSDIVKNYREKFLQEEDKHFTRVFEELETVFKEVDGLKPASRSNTLDQENRGTTLVSHISTSGRFMVPNRDQEDRYFECDDETDDVQFSGVSASNYFGPLEGSDDGFVSTTDTHIGPSIADFIPRTDRHVDTPRGSDKCLAGHMEEQSSSSSKVPKKDKSPTLPLVNYPLNDDEEEEFVEKKDLSFGTRRESRRFTIKFEGGTVYGDISGLEQQALSEDESRETFDSKDD